MVELNKTAPVMESTISSFNKKYAGLSDAIAFCLVCIASCPRALSACVGIVRKRADNLASFTWKFQQEMKQRQARLASPRLASPRLASPRPRA